MPTLDQIIAREQVYEVFERALDIGSGDITPHSTLRGLGVDSLDAINIITQLEKAFDVTIADAEAKGWKTVEDVVEAIQGKKGVANPRSVTVETTYADRDTAEPVEVCHSKNEDIFLLRVGGMGLGYEFSRREARGLRNCLDAALSDNQTNTDQWTCSTDSFGRTSALRMRIKL